MLSNGRWWTTRERERDWWICSIISWVCLFVARCASGPTSLYHSVPRCASFPPSEPIMKELYRSWQITVSLPHNTNNRGYHERMEGRIFCTALMNTSSHLWGASMFPSPVYFCAVALLQSPSVRSWWGKINGMVASFVLSGYMEVWNKTAGSNSYNEKYTFGIRD